MRVLVDYVANGRVRCDYATTLGAGGLFVSTDDPLPGGSETRLRFRVPGSDRLVEVDARVVWVVKPGEAGSVTPGMGLTFTDAAETAELARELASLAS